jgi:hypothetical protein
MYVAIVCDSYVLVEGRCQADFTLPFQSQNASPQRALNRDIRTVLLRFQHRSGAF